MSTFEQTKKVWKLGLLKVGFIKKLNILPDNEPFIEETVDYSWITWMIHHTGRGVNSSCNSKLIITDNCIGIGIEICEKKNTIWIWQVY